MRRTPAPLSVTRPPPSSTTSGLSLKTLAVAFIVMVTGFGPQLKPILPPCATAETTAAEVQLAGVPLPITWLGFATDSACAATGTAQWPSGLPVPGTAKAAELATAKKAKAQREGPRPLSEE